MKFAIHGTVPLGYEDTWIINGETLEHIREQAQHIVKTRELTDVWLEEL